MQQGSTPVKRRKQAFNNYIVEYIFEQTIIIQFHLFYSYIEHISLNKKINK